MNEDEWRRASAENSGELRKEDLFVDHIFLLLMAAVESLMKVRLLISSFQALEIKRNQEQRMLLEYGELSLSE